MVAVLITCGLVLSTSFTLLQWKMFRAEWPIRRLELQRNPVPRGEVIRSLAVTGGIFAVVGLAVWVGWRSGGLDAGLLAAIGVASLVGLAVSGFAIKAGRVPRK